MLSIIGFIFSLQAVSILLSAENDQK